MKWVLTLVIFVVTLTAIINAQTLTPAEQQELVSVLVHTVKLPLTQEESLFVRKLMAELTNNDLTVTRRLTTTEQRYISKLGDALRADGRVTQGKKMPQPADTPKVSLPLETVEDYQQHFEKIMENKERRSRVRDAIKFAYNMYEKYAMGHDELKPVTGSYRDWVDGGMGMTIVDSLDTLYIAGLSDEYNRALEYVKTMKPFNTIDSTVSVFETNIRMVGGFLAIYDLSQEPIFLQKAKEVADILLTAFDEIAGVFAGSVNLKRGGGKVYGSVCLAEIGTMQLEFRRLSMLTKDPKYDEKVTRIMKLLEKYAPADGLYGEDFDPFSGTFSGTIKLGARADSMYEYLLKQWLLTGKTEKIYLDMYQRSLSGIMDKMVVHFDKLNPPQSFLTEIAHNRVVHRVEHLACFAAGMFALGEQTGASHSEEVMKTAQQLTAACALAYNKTASKTGPEAFDYSIATGEISASGYYIQRPETIESLFYLYRVTGNKKYQDWAWYIFTNIEEKCKVAKGFTGLHDVNRPGSYDDMQQSFFLAETLKYLYLIFSPSDVIPLDKFVFNTEAHPLLIQQRAK